MNTFKIRDWMAGRMMGVALGALLMWPGAVGEAAEQSFEVLQIGTKTYKNVTVTTTAKDYVFILHSAGMTNVKVSELSPEVRQQLGYVEKPKSQGNVIGTWAKTGLSRVETPAVKALEQQLRASAAVTWLMGALRDPQRAPWLLGIAFVGWLFFCQLCNMICRKTGELAGVLIWWPVLQVFPLLRAARMSGGWFLAFFVPVLNVVASIVWSIKIVGARGKSGWVALWLLLPVTSFFAFLYLAFSAPAPRKEEAVIEIMTLEAA